MADEIVLRIKDLCAQFQTEDGIVKAVDGVSLEIRKGEMFGLVGESGCGKTMTANCILRLAPASCEMTNGHVLFSVPEDILQRIERLATEERELASGAVPRDEASDSRTAELRELYQEWDLLWSDERSMRKVRGKSIAMVFQDPGSALDPVMNIGDQIAEVFLAHDRSGLADEVLNEYAASNDRSINGNGKGGSLFASVGRSIWIPMLKRTSSDPEDRLARMCSKIPILDRFERSIERIAFERAIAIMREVRLAEPEEIARSYPFELSGGMQQRVMIAMALACGPNLLIADEPTTSLDVTMQSQVLDLIMSIRAQREMSVLLITHNLAVVAETCDRAAVMYAGSIVEIGNVEQLFDDPHHPYTIALLDSIPGITGDNDRLRSIPGSVPGALEAIEGCRFHPRCPQACEICKSDRPKLIEIGPGHQVACHLYGGEIDG